MSFKIPNIPPTTNKSIRFPNDVIEQVEEAIRGRDCTFTAGNPKTSRYFSAIYRNFIRFQGTGEMPLCLPERACIRRRAPEPAQRQCRFLFLQYPARSPP